VVLTTALLGFGAGIVWAFVGGLTANLLTTDPLGSVPLILLVVSVLVAGGDRVAGRLTWVFPILAAFAASVAYDLMSLGLGLLLEQPLRIGIPTSLIVPAAFLNAAIAGLLLYPARTIAMRFSPEEKPAW
jgi:cell shape-determining protein MreD